MFCMSFHKASTRAATLPSTHNIPPQHTQLPALSKISALWTFVAWDWLGLGLTFTSVQTYSAHFFVPSFSHLPACVCHPHCVRNGYLPYGCVVFHYLWLELIPIYPVYYQWPFGKFPGWVYLGCSCCVQCWMWFCREYCYVSPGYIQRSGVARPQNVCSLPADTARCSILCGGHVEFLSIHVPQSHSPLAVFPLMGVYLFVPLASSKKELSHQETGHSA